MTDQQQTTSSALLPLSVLAWLWILVPFGYGLWELLTKVGPLFTR
jgi:hypothetical protein